MMGRPWAERESGAQSGHGGLADLDALGDGGRQGGALGGDHGGGVTMAEVRAAARAAAAEEGGARHVRPRLDDGDDGEHSTFQPTSR